jgi:hypothetical protein
MRERVLFIANVVILAFCIMAAFACCHDNAVMRHYNDVMREDMARIRQTQERQASEMRQVKTESEIMLRIATESIYTQEGEE